MIYAIKQSWSFHWMWCLSYSDKQERLKEIMHLVTIYRSQSMALNPSPTNGPTDGHLKLVNLLNIFHPPPIDTYPMLSRSFHPSCKYDYIGVNSSLQSSIIPSVNLCRVSDRGELSYLAPPRQWKHFSPLFQAVFLSEGGGYYPPDWVKHHASQSQDRNNKYFILYIEFCINNKI